MHDPIIDTDAERDHESFFVMTFNDGAQCDESVRYIQATSEPDGSIHQEMYDKAVDPIFICWEDV